MNWIRNGWTKLNPSEKRYIFVVWVIALALRVVYALTISLIPADYTGIDLDAVEYDQLGWSVAQGRGYLDVHGDPNSTRFPGYPFFLALIYYIFGHHHRAALLVQALLGSLIPLLVYFTARQLFEEKTSRITGIVAACYPVFIYYVGWLMTENLFLLFISLLIYLTVSLDRRIDWQKLAFMGFVIGLLSLTRGAGLPFIGIIPLYVFLQFKGRIEQRIIRGAVIAGIAVLTLVPWTLRNSLIYGRVMLPSSEGGGILWLSFNNVNFADLYVTNPAFDYVKQVGREKAKSEEFYHILSENNVFGFTSVKKLFSIYYPEEPAPTSEQEGSRRLGQKAMAMLYSNPGIWVAKMVKQVFRFWHVLNERGRYVWGYGFILPFSLAGFWLLRHRIPDLMPLYLFLIVIYGIAVLFFADARFRMPFEGIFIIIGAFAIQRFLGLFRREYWGYAILVGFFAFNYYLHLHSPQVRLVIRSVAGALGFQLSAM